MVFESGTGGGVSRSFRVLERLKSSYELPEAGRFLDVGCGNGATLRAFSQIWPGWSLAGSELSARYRLEVEAIPRVEKLYTEPVEGIAGQYDLVSLIHVLEHIPNPVGYLRGLKAKLARGGLLLIEVPNFSANPFDLVIADHCSHFGVATLRAVVEAAGFEVKSASEEWIPKEITLVAKLGKSEETALNSGLRAAGAGGDARKGNRRIQWLAEVIDGARAVSERCRDGGGKFGLFGTTIAATWLYGELGGAVDFFVDENRACTGNLYLGRPVFLPDDLPAQSEVYVCLPQPASSQVVSRLGLRYREAVFRGAPDL
jgi:2-polyprenyl-3-methyl-5-hydroxy-6-metoxy-1,4-benzoquinol methylase